MASDEQTADLGSSTTVEPEDWATWCAETTQALAGRRLTLGYADSALGEVAVAEQQPFQGLDHDGFGSAVALTLRYGDSVVPLRYVIGEPRDVSVRRDAAGQIEEVAITDSTGRRSVIGLT